MEWDPCEDDEEEETKEKEEETTMAVAQEDTVARYPPYPGHQVCFRTKTVDQSEFTAQKEDPCP